MQQSSKQAVEPTVGQAAVEPATASTSKLAAEPVSSKPATASTSKPTAEPSTTKPVAKRAGELATIEPCEHATYELAVEHAAAEPTVEQAAEQQQLDKQ